MREIYRAKKIMQPVGALCPAATKAAFGLAVLVLGFAFAVAPGSAGAMGRLFAEETVGKQFREVVAEIDAQCRKEKVGPYLDPKDPKYRDKIRYTQCDILKLKAYDPLATPEGRFAHSLKLPPPHDRAPEVYKTGMTGDEYFGTLCQSQAGEFVLRTAESVQGILQARPYQRTPNGYFNIVFFTVEKGEMNLKEVASGLVRPPAGQYQFLEIPRSATEPDYSHLPFERHFVRSPGRENGSAPNNIASKTMPGAAAIDSEAVSNLLSHYAFTWRGLNRPEMTEHGIEGSELIIYEIGSREVLAFRRYFVRYTPNPTYRDRRYTNAVRCPKSFDQPPHIFIQSVLKPAGWISPK